MAYTEAGKRATIKYIKNAYDRIEIKVPKGQRETIAAYADAAGESVNMYVQKAIFLRMGIDGWPDEATDEESE
jgi:predicted HicB family RNase H-like nuclease